MHAGVAQLVEHRSCKAVAAGSSPAAGFVASSLTRMRGRPCVAAVLVAAVAAGACSNEARRPAAAAPPAVRTSAPVNESPAAAPAVANDVPAGPAFPLVAPPGRRPIVRDGLDWSLPSWTRPAPFSGFYSEVADTDYGVAVRAVDVSWAQIAPTRDGPLDLDARGGAQAMSFASLSSQLRQRGPYWLRLFASGVDWAPAWVVSECGVGAIGTDYDGQDHLPIWNDCVWTALAGTWRKLLVDQGILADPDFRFAYVPGAFTWVEYDYDMIASAVDRGALARDAYLTWYRRMLGDLATIAGDAVGRLVFTGEDYPWGPFGTADDLLTFDATRAGFGVRTGITELANFHLSEAPSYGSMIRPNGHLATDERAPSLAPATVRATENECYLDCGFTSKDPSYAVITSNLKALQLRMNWVYVVPAASRMDALAPHWDWVRLSLGRDAATAADAWAALRDAEDRFWSERQPPFGPGGRRWRRRPFIRNLERFLVQVDARGAVAHRSRAAVHRGDPAQDNGVAFEGLATAPARGDRALAFRLDDRFLDGRRQRVLVKVTFLGGGRGTVAVRTAAGTSATVARGARRTWRTATFPLSLRAGHSLPGRTDLQVVGGGRQPLTVRFVRVVRLEPPA